jgi:hypothetical protein
MLIGGDRIAGVNRGAYYFDLCDNADFVRNQRIRRREALVTPLSGMSSVPAVSSAAVTALCDGNPLMIETAILPGNKAERGRSCWKVSSSNGDFYVENKGRDRCSILVRLCSRILAYTPLRLQVSLINASSDHFNCSNSYVLCAGLELS